MSDWSYDGLTHRRRPTRSVMVGDVAVGSAHPIRVQSMTTPATTDTMATVDQIERLAHAGCEIARVTVPTSRDADNLPAIRAEMGRRGVRLPLVADIHFTPAAAMKAVEHVEKIRVNPGNYADKKKFAVREYSDAEYAAELERIERVFAPLVERARELGVSMRIGTNHGSLSDRIMNRYGDTPEGMVESALEFVRICESRGYRELILSMKSSNPLVVIHAYRLLCTRMAAEAMDYPLHLGVTEAGDGEDGRVKSAVGIGALLDEGLGDTVRVSLTEDPVHEIPVARMLVAPYNEGRVATRPPARVTHELRDPFAYARREAHEVAAGPHRLGSGTVLVEVPLDAALDDAEALRRELDAHVGVRVPEETRPELVSVEIDAADRLDALSALGDSLALVAPGVALSARIAGDLAVEALDDIARWVATRARPHLVLEAGRADAARVAAAARTAHEAGSSLLVELAHGDDAESAVDAAVALAAAAPDGLALALSPTPERSPLLATRLLVARLAAAGLRHPLVLIDRPEARGADPQLGASAAIGGLLCDGIGDAVRLDVGGSQRSRRLAFGVLQAARVRITRTEFISCPSCGRTLFDLEQTTARIKSRTSHLKGLKIAVMGCIVNGPGEMADADFGYVGWGENKIALFVGKEMVERDVPTERADDRLVELIREHGRWVDPPVHAVDEA